MVATLTPTLPPLLVHLDIKKERNMTNLGRELTLKVAELELDMVKMREYLVMKVKENDWHGVADAAMDMRDIENKLLGIQIAQKMLREGL